MNYYFIYGPEDVVTSYTDLTGKPELPPLWALGYHQCELFRK
jgi:alpha-glucosidase